ncbi:helix-turn-helix domain-containing protein [Gilvimarinus sp. SDUM040013]|uniref:Helix-turn-helix domain-containing protein n=1 Tax=Gilvimarinus gilvus TaxID=3058038 RepID=A0ABU4S0D5_9GAMM|nr:helix-turn-helix domain-containing protein [Gilvimarinus sp. SDUM040013]MDO3385891.1 helix-turn-helix domain-containing protein [Gilvimarinus sp. SDUM040013]MDX6850606.1 helix-turn-helix domain-containing protein [Gilvimarinus sp. SDUM040013]
MQQFYVWFNKAQFNAYDLILIMLMVQCAVFGFLMLIRPPRPLSQRLLSVFLMSLAVGQLVFLLTYNPVLFSTFHPLWGDRGYALWALVYSTHGPMLYHYTRALTSESYSWRWAFLWPLAPGFAVIVLEPLGWHSLVELMFWREFVLVCVLGFVISVGFAIATLFHIERYSEHLKNHFCTVELMEYGWLRLMVWGFLLVWVLEVLPPFFYAWAPWPLMETVVHLPGVLELALIYFIVFAGLFYARATRQIPVTEEEKVTRRDDASQEESQSHQSYIAKRMTEEKLYCRPRLNIERLAEELSLSPRQLSQIINRELGKNFFEFINDYRLEEVKQRLRSVEWADSSIQEIYESVGFRSRSSFFTLFRKYVGMTPSQYRDAILPQEPEPESGT